MSTYDFLSSNPILDFGNFLICFFCTIICTKYFQLKKIHFYFLSFHSILPFFINDFFMDYAYMPDQTRYIFYTDFFRYITEQKSINYGITINDEFFFSKTGFASYLLSLIPTPNVLTTRSLGFANKVLFIILFSYLYKKKIFTNFTAYFFLAYPSFALYSGIALKEMLSVFFMFLIIERSYNFKLKQIPLLAFLFLACTLIKYQFTIFIAPISVLLIVNPFDFKNKGYNFFIYFVCIILILCIGFLLFNKFEESINSMRYSFFIDNGNTAEDFIYLKNFFDFFILSFVELFKSFIEPLPSFNKNIYNNIQFLENIIIVVIIICVTYISMKSNYRKAPIWIFFLLFSLTMTAVIVDNIGTLSRYKFPIILTYVIFISYNDKNARTKKN